MANINSLLSSFQYENNRTQELLEKLMQICYQVASNTSFCEEKTTSADVSNKKETSTNSVVTNLDREYNILCINNGKLHDYISCLDESINGPATEGKVLSSTPRY